MRRWLLWALALCLILCGCSKTPVRAADGTSWSKEWTTVGNVLGVEEPGNGLALRGNNDALSVSNMYLASWTVGEWEPFLNEDGDQVELYPAQIDVLVYGRKDEDTAQRVLEDWVGRQSRNYDIRDTRQEVHNGQEYLISAYDCVSEKNPYSRGVWAATVYGNYAVSLEFNCQEEFSGDEVAILAGFLDGCHYAE